MKMKISMVFLLLLDIPRLKGQQRIEEFETILLRLEFPSYYKTNIKACCRPYQAGCFPLMDSTGYIYEPLRGRVTKTEHDGWIEFKISNVRLGDSGFYRCFVVRTLIYKDYDIEISQASFPHRPTTPFGAIKPSTALPSDSRRPALSEDHTGSPSAPWRLDLLLAAVASVAVMIFVSLVIGVVCFRLKSKRKQPETVCESAKQDSWETSGIVYTTVGFSARQNPSEVYENLKMPRTRAAAAPDREHAGMVEYSTLAIHQ